MPGEPGLRHFRGAPHASDAVRPHAADTPYDEAISLSMTIVRIVGGRPYCGVSTRPEIRRPA